MKKRHGGKRKNAGRPKAGRVPLTICVKPGIAALITRLAFIENRSLGEVVEERFTQNNIFTVA